MNPCTMNQSVQAGNPQMSEGVPSRTIPVQVQMFSALLDSVAHSLSTSGAAQMNGGGAGALPGG